MQDAEILNWPLTRFEKHSAMRVNEKNLEVLKVKETVKT